MIMPHMLCSSSVYTIFYSVYNRSRVGNIKLQKNHKDEDCVNTSKSCSFKISSEIGNIGNTVNNVVCYLQDLCGELKEDTLYEVKVILNELVVNAIKHGNKFNSCKYVTITTKFTKNKYAIFIIEDEGEGYNCRCMTEGLKKVKRTDELHELCSMKENGRGLWIVQNLCESLYFNNKGNKVVVRKQLLD